MFPVWINDGTTEMPIDPIFYVIAKDGIYLKKTMGHFDTMTKVNSISILDAVESKATLKVAKIKTRQFAQILSLFRDVYKKYRAEANVILHYNRKKKRYRIDVPTQGVTGASVNYVNGEDSYDNYIRIGTIHSHASMTAFHSGTDQHDEESWDGLHITLGKLNQDYFEISCSIMASGERFMVNPVEYIEGLELVEYEEEYSYVRYQWLGGVQTPVEPTKKLGWKIIADEKDFKYPTKWMDKIDKFRPVPKVTTVSASSGNIYGGKYIPSNINSFYPYQSKQQKGLFDGIYDIDQSEWNPCNQCPYRHHKSDLMMQELIDSVDDEMAEKLGFVDDEDEASPFYVNENPTKVEGGKK